MGSTVTYPLHSSSSKHSMQAWVCLDVGVECGSAFCGCGMVGGLLEVHVCGRNVCMDWDGSWACVCCWCGVVVGVFV